MNNKKMDIKIISFKGMCFQQLKCKIILINKCYKMK